MLPDIIPAISEIKQLEQFLKSDHEWCIVMHLHLNFLSYVVKSCHEHHKKIIIHVDLIHGLSSDEFATQYLTQKLKVDGIASIKAKVLNAAKKAGVTCIQRIFLIDSSSLERSISLWKETQPDYVEILPALACDIIFRLRKRITSPMICGGLITNEEEIKKCFSAGASAVTTSSLKLADQWYRNKM